MVIRSNTITQMHDEFAGAFAAVLSDLCTANAGSTLTDTMALLSATMLACFCARQPLRQELPFLRFSGRSAFARTCEERQLQIARSEYWKHDCLSPRTRARTCLKKHDTHLRDPVQKRRQEIEADAFAIEVMRRIGQVPLGVEFWFDVERIGHVQGIRRVTSARFPTEAEWQKYIAGVDHPVTTERLEALSVAIEKAPDSFVRNQADQARWTRNAKILAQYFRLGTYLPPSVVRVAEYEKVRDLRLADLKPRKAAFTIPAPPSRNRTSTVYSPCAEPLPMAVKTEWIYCFCAPAPRMGGYSSEKPTAYRRENLMAFCISWREDGFNGRGIERAQGDTFEAGNGRIGGNQRRVERCARKEREDGALKAGLIL